MTLKEAAKWFDEEYARLSTWRGRVRGHDAKRLEGELGGLAEAGAIRRAMQRDGKPPQHRKPYRPGV